MRSVLVSAAIVLAGIAAGISTTSTAHAMPIERPASALPWVHVVQPGETIFCIARGYGVDPWVIAAQNGLYYNADHIYPGMSLIIPAGSPRILPPGPTCARQDGAVPPPPPQCRAYYTIQPGDILYRIAAMYGVSIQSIVVANGMTDPNYIRAYDRLCIP